MVRFATELDVRRYLVTAVLSFKRKLLHAMGVKGGKEKGKKYSITV